MRAVPVDADANAGKIRSMTKATKKKKRNRSSPGYLVWDWCVSTVMIGVVKLVGLLPYRWRVPTGGWVLGEIAAPFMGYRKRIRANLEMVFPQMQEAEKKHLARMVPRQIGRTLTEMFSPEDLMRVAKDATITGGGVDALYAARDAGQPVVFVSGHLGNYDVARSALMQRGFKIGALYRSMNYRYFNEFYVSKIAQIGEPLFLRGRRGLAEMVRFLRQGNAVAMMIDQHMKAGEKLTFFGHPARTPLSAAEMALKYNALLVPCYCIRQPDGLNFEAVFEAPIPHTNAIEMTQALNDSLEGQVRAHMDQWLWVHRRWKDRDADSAV